MMQTSSCNAISVKYNCAEKGGSTNERKATRGGGATVTGLLQETADDFCDNYCKFPNQYDDEEELMARHCDQCPLNKI